MSDLDSNTRRTPATPPDRHDTGLGSPSTQVRVPVQETGQENLAHFLIFVGRLVAIAGGLAMIRLWTFDWFYAALIPIGIGMTIAGARIRRRIAINEPGA